jgi:hypothetical protein
MRLAALAFAFGVVAVIGPRLALTSIVFGEATWAGNLDPGVHVYGGAIPEDSGWRTMGYRPSGELLEVLDGVNRPATSEEYWRAAVRTWIHHPLSSAAVALHKLYRAWRHPYNDSRRQFIAGDNVLRVYHGVVLLLGLFGMPLTLRRGRLGWLLVATSIYLWATYLAVAIEVRYAITVMPLMLCFAAVACVDFAAGWKRADHSRQLLPAAAGALLVLLVVLSACDEGCLLAFLPSLSPATAHSIRLAVAVILSLGAAVVAGALLRPAMQRWAVLVAVGVPLLIADLVMIAGGAQAPEWRQWSAPLASGSAIARKEIELAADISRPTHLNLLFDVQRTCSQPFAFVIRVGGREVYRLHDTLGEPNSMLLKVEDSWRLLQAQRRGTESVPGWRMLTLPAELIDGGALQIEMLVEDGPGGVPCVELFGDYQDDAGSYIGPAVLSPWRAEHGSVYRYLVAGDYRMWRRTKLDAPSQSRLGKGDVWADDLSPAPGRQTGRYRMFLVLTYSDRRLIL